MNRSSPVHVPVLLDDVLQWLGPLPGGVFVDGTLGGGGHTRAIADRVGPTGVVISLDRDPAAIDAARKNLAGLPVRMAQANFCDLPEVLAELQIPFVDGVVLDLGLSSDQLADPGRGFSFSAEGPLDLRFDPTEGEPAWRLLNRLSAEHLAELIYRYGEEQHSRRIARAVVERRRQSPIRTAAELAEIVRRAVPGPRRNQRIDPATKTFQALRIAVNDELKSLEIALRRLPDCLRPGGRLAVISFHSLEDRRVKEAFRDDPRYEVLTRKPVRPSEEEISANPRARSAKLRVAARRQGSYNGFSNNPGRVPCGDSTAARSPTSQAGMRYGQTRPTG
jgi:16S rRNA (cytosine1402-N4)-methyltransferase